jgi:hypothetical protein
MISMLIEMTYMPYINVAITFIGIPGTVIVGVAGEPVITVYDTAGEYVITGGEPVISDHIITTLGDSFILLLFI